MMNDNGDSEGKHHYFYPRRQRQNVELRDVVNGNGDGEGKGCFVPFLVCAFSVVIGRIGLV